MPIMAPQAAPKTEADRKLTDITKAVDGKLDPAAVVPKLQQFIKENPDYPRLESVYSTLVAFASQLKDDPTKTLAIADEALARFPKTDSPVRPAAIRAKFAAYRNAKDNAGFAAFVLKIQETETSPALLEIAALNDQESAPKLLEKAISERRKNPDAAAAPTLDTLRSDYALILDRVGRRDEALRLSVEMKEETKKSLAELDALPRDDSRQQRRALLQLKLGRRCTNVAAMLSAAGKHQRALDYIALAEQCTPADERDFVSDYETQRAGIFAKMGKPALELDSRVAAFSARMEVATRDKIRDLSEKLGRSPDEAFARARELRAKRATPVRGFELKTPEGTTVTLDSLRAKVTLVNFFFPT
jgi:hypothetical protein